LALYESKRHLGKNKFIQHINFKAMPLPDNIQIFSKWNWIEPTETKGYTVFFGNWGTYYAEMTKEQLLKYYKVLFKNSCYNCFGDLYIYFDGKLLRSVNKQDNAGNYILTKYANEQKIEFKGQF
jgi:hypothetical protein